jgi:hypothetical protein
VAGITAYLDCPAVTGYDFPGDCQSQTVASSQAASLIKPFKNVAQLLGWYSRTSIGNGDFNSTDRLVDCQYHYFSLTGSILDGIIKQVREDLFKAVDVTENGHKGFNFWF